MQNKNQVCNPKETMFFTEISSIWTMYKTEQTTDIGGSYPRKHHNHSFFREQAKFLALSLSCSNSLPLIYKYTKKKKHDMFRDNDKS